MAPNRRNSLSCTVIELLDKDCAIKGLVVWYIVWLGSMISRMGFWTSAMCVVWSLVVVRIAIKKRPYRYISNTYRDVTYIFQVNGKSSMILQENFTQLSSIQLKYPLIRYNGYNLRYQYNVYIFFINLKRLCRQFYPIFRSHGN